MAEFGRPDVVSAKSAQDFREGSLGRYKFVYWSGDGEVSLATNATTTALAGVIITDAATNDHCSVAYSGKQKVVAGGAITVNALITTNGSGRATAASSGDMVMGRALEAAGADGQIITCQLNEPYFTGNL